MNASKRTWHPRWVCAGTVMLWMASTAGAATASNTPDVSWQQRERLLGDMGGLRPALQAHGITLDLEDTEEYLRVFSGGAHRGGAYYGLAQAGVTMDAGQALGWDGGTLHAGMLQIHGHRASLTNDDLGALQTASNIEATPDTRLQELWWQQNLGSHFNVRAGQLALDDEFLASSYAGAFINGMFGWPALPSIDLPSGGPAYPLSSLGLRAQWDAGDAVTLRAALVDGYPGGHGNGNPQKVNRHGLQFHWHGKPLAIAELEYRTALGNAVATPASSLQGTYKIGVWHHFGRFADPRFAADAPTRRGDWSAYVMGDQEIWRSATHPAQRLGLFARLMGAPGGRNPVSFSANAGVVLQAPLPGRDADTLSLGWGMARLSGGARTLAADLGRTPHASERYLEISYVYQIAPSWTVRLDAQRYIHPAAATLAPGTTLPPARNAWLLGLRTHITF